MAVVQPALSDFVLFPRDQFFFDMSDERADETFANTPFNMDQDIHQDFLDLAATSFASYPSTAAYSSLPVPFYDTPHLVVEGPKDSSRQLHHQGYTPSASPSTSMSHSLDHALSTLSSTSCASVQSTASSAVGSPYSHATHSLPGPDQWMDHNQGLGIAPGIIQREGYRHDTFPLQAMESDQVTFDPDRFTGNFVGELREISSTFFSSSPAMCSPISSASDSHFLVTSTLSSPSLALDTSVETRHVTIDTILQEVNGSVGSPGSLISPGSAISSVKASPGIAQQACISSSPAKDPPTFRSPTTPASAMSLFAHAVTSPFTIRRQESRAGAMGAIDHSRDQNSPSVENGPHPYAQATEPIPNAPTQAPRVQFRSPFFKQSSGRFIAPLESSCWFSLNFRSFPILVPHPVAYFLFKCLL